MVTVEGVKREHVKKILLAAYEADKTAVYCNNELAVSGSSLLAVAEQVGTSDWDWHVRLSSGVWMDSTLKEIVPVEYRYRVESGRTLSPSTKTMDDFARDVSVMIASIALALAFCYGSAYLIGLGKNHALEKYALEKEALAAKLDSLEDVARELSRRSDSLSRMLEIKEEAFEVMHGKEL